MRENKKKKLEKMIHQKKLSEKIFLVGHVNNVYSYMKNSDVFVLSSLWEEVGFVIVEAAMNNLFVISSNCPNGPSEILDNNKGGLLFKISDYEDLAKKILFFRSNKFDCLKKIKHAKKRLHRFDYNKNLKKYFTFLKTELN